MGNGNFFKGYDFDGFNIKEFLAAYLNSVVADGIAEILHTEV